MMRVKQSDQLRIDIKKALSVVFIIVFSIFFLEKMVEGPSQANVDTDRVVDLAKEKPLPARVTPDTAVKQSPVTLETIGQSPADILHRIDPDQEFGLVRSKLSDAIEDKSQVIDDGKSDEITYIPGDIVIKLTDENIDLDEFAKVHALDIVSNSKNSLYARLIERRPLGDEINSLMEDDRVLYAEPNYIYRATYIPDDPFFNTNWPGKSLGKQWGPQKIGSPAAWDISTGTPSSIVAVIDTGVDYNHPELAGRVINGWDFSNNDTDSIDDNGHGSHVAGIIASRGDNSFGIAGTAWNSTILAIKALDDSGSGTLIDIADGIIYAADNGADVINLSLAGPSFAQILQDAVDYAYNKGVVVVAAAGNDWNSSINYPAGLNNVIGVGATDQSDVWAHFSNFNSSVDISAPGVDISSLGSTYLGYSYSLMDGTSMSAPFVAGVASLIDSIEPEWSPGQIERRLLETAKDLGTVGRDEYYGWGRLDAYKAIFKMPDLLEIVKVTPTGVLDPLSGPIVVDYELTGDADIYMNVLNGSDEVVYSLGPIPAISGAGSLSWDGKDARQVVVNPGWYRLDIYAKASYAALNKNVLIEVDYGLPLMLGAPTTSLSSFNPLAGETVTISTAIQKESLLGMVIYEADREQVIVFPLQKRVTLGTASFVWDGRNGSGSLVPSAVYDYFIIGIDPGGSSSVVSGSVTVYSP